MKLMVGVGMFGSSGIGGTARSSHLNG
jgi:hypothetical protein